MYNIVVTSDNNMRGYVRGWFTDASGNIPEEPILCTTVNISQALQSETQHEAVDWVITNLKFLMKLNQQAITSIQIVENNKPEDSIDVTQLLNPNEPNVKKRLELIYSYAKTKENDNVIKRGKYYYGFKNDPKRREIREKYVQLLPENERLAVMLFKYLNNPSSEQHHEWNSEENGLIFNWSANLHGRYLEKANKLLEIHKLDEILNFMEILYPAQY